MSRMPWLPVGGVNLRWQRRGIRAKESHQFGVETEAGRKEARKYLKNLDFLDCSLILHLDNGGKSIYLKVIFELFRAEA